ncbi:MAG: DUF1501 domain-containing protein [Planctomycetes bacterium]|nr:DUF1501 domain-containing protein [Planctomycetota bacterium]
MSRDRRGNPFACPGPLDRRAWLKLGGLGLGALSTGISPTMARLFAAGSAANEAGAKAQLDHEFSVILFWANGGPSHIDLFDLKPQAPAEYRGPFRPIATTVPGMEITELLPKLAACGDRFTLIRSLHHERNQHSGGTHRFLTGHSSVAANLPRSEFPEIGSIVARRLEGQTVGVPPFVANTPFYGGGPAYLGPAYEAFMPDPNPVTASGNNIYDPVPIYRRPGGTDNLAISSEGLIALTRRRNLQATLDRLPREIDSSGMMPAMDAFQQRAVEMLSSSRVRRAFDLSEESERTRLRYGETHWGKSLLTCRRLVEAGVRFVQCQATYRLRAETGRTSNWDDHSVNSHIFKAYEEKLPSFDHSVSAIIEDLFERGLDRRVLFIFCGEFGRTPLIRHQDPSGRPGRDHWAQAMSVLVSGGGLRMGQVIGATSRRAEEPVERIMDSNCLLATIYRRFGIDPRGTFPDHSGRPIHILPSGEPIAELL